MQALQNIYQIARHAKLANIAKACQITQIAKHANLTKLISIATKKKQGCMDFKHVTIIMIIIVT